MNRTILDRIRPGVPALALVALGLAVAGIGATYPVGGWTDMGPGFLPMVLGLGLALVGAAVLFTGSPVGPVDDHPLRPLVAVTSGMLAWILLAESAGFIPAGIVQLVLASLGLAGARWRTTVAVAVLLSVFGYVVFVVQLGVPLRAFAF